MFDTFEARRLLSGTVATWTGLGNDNHWSNSANWSLNAVPTSGQDVSFPLPSGSTQVQVNLDVDATIGDLELDHTVLEGSNILTLQGNVTTDPGTQSAILTPITLAHDTTMTAAYDLVLGGVINDGGHHYGLTMNGGGEFDMGVYGDTTGTVGLILPGNVENTYTGVTNLDDVELNLNGTLTSSVQAQNNSYVIANETLGSFSAANTALFAANLSTATPAMLTLSNGLTLDNNSNLYSDIASSTSYSTYVVNGGTIDLGGAQFDTYGNAASIGTIITLIHNNTGQPIVGTFAGMAEGSEQLIGGTWYQISYVGGTNGRDVTLTANAGPPDVWIGGNGNWSVASNWSLGSVPTTGEDVVFDTANSSVNVDPLSVEIGSLTSDGTTLQGNAITVDGTFTNTAGNSIINDAITLTGNTTVTSSAGLLNFEAPISDGGSGFNFTVLAGHIQLGVSNSRAMTYTGTTTVDTGAELDVAVAVASPIVLDAGSTLTIAGNGDPSITSHGGTINVVSPYNNQAQQLIVPGTFTLDHSSTLSIPIDSTSVGYGDTSAGYGQIVVSSGTITLDGTLATSRNSSFNFVPPIGTSYTIIANNTGSDVTGTFNNLPQNGEFESHGTWFRINYDGGSTGHDVVLSVVNPPAVWTGNAGDDEWFTAGNWLANAVPTPGGDIYLEASGDHIDIASPVVVGTMELSDATLTNSAMTINGDLAVAGNFTFQNSVLFSGDTTVAVVPSQDLGFEGGVTDSGNNYSMTLSGGGQMDLRSGGFDMAGGTEVTGGSFFAVGADLGSPLTVDAGSTAELFTAAGSGITSNGGAVELYDGMLHAADVAESGDIALDSNTTLDVRLDGTQTNTLYAYSQLADDAGQISLGGATLNLALGSNSHSYAPAIGDQYTIIANSTGNDVSGTFAGLPEGTKFQLDGYWLQISYHGGTSGQDVVLTAIQAPSATVASALSSTAHSGDNVQFHATVSGTDVNNDSPAGSVRFYDGFTLLATEPLVNGAATMGTTALSVGTHTITAVYSGDSNYFGSSATSFTETIHSVVSFVRVSDPVRTSNRFATFSALATGTGPGGESALTYNWSTVTAPPGAKAPLLSANGTNAAKNMTMRVYKDGTYQMRVTATDSQGASAIRDVTLIVSQTAEAIRLTPHAQQIKAGSQLQYGGILLDQFNHPMRTSYTLAWKLDTNSGSITTSGLFSSKNIRGHVEIEADWDDVVGTVGATLV